MIPVCILEKKRDEPLSTISFSLRVYCFFLTMKKNLQYPNEKNLPGAS